MTGDHMVDGRARKAGVADIAHIDLAVAARCTQRREGVLRAGRIVLTPPPGLLEELETDDQAATHDAAAADASEDTAVAAGAEPGQADADDRA
jgi:hypothetical protein